eukprot:scaffold8772_cov150-Skeletonema_menzelii.AAC.7
MNSRGPPGRGRGGGRGFGSRGRGYYSGGGRYNNHRGRGDYGGRGGRFIPRGGGRTPRMGSYSSIGRGDGRDHGNHLDRSRDNDNNRVGSYADLASSIPSYSDIGRSVGGGQGDRGGYDGGGGPTQNNNNNRDVGGMSSYAQLGEMSQPPPSLGMKRGRPIDDRPPQMMGSNNYGADDNMNMGPRGGGGPPPSYRGHNNRDDGMPRGPQPPLNDYRQPLDMQDKRSSVSSHQPLTPDDQFGGRRGPDWRGRSDSHEDQFGRQLPPKRTSSGYGRGPPGRGHPRFVPDANRVDNNMQRPGSLSPPPRRESSYQRFDGQRSSHDSSMPSYASIADKPISQPVEERPTQQHENTKKDEVVAEVVKRDEAKVVESKRRPSTPPPSPVEAPVVVVPPSPKSPPSAPPSAYALAMARMVEMNADMDFAWVRMQMLDTEVKLIEARLESME